MLEQFFEEILFPQEYAVEFSILFRPDRIEIYNNKAWPRLVEVDPGRLPKSLDPDLISTEYSLR